MLVPKGLASMLHHGVNNVACPCPGSLPCCCPACLMEWNLDQPFGVSEGDGRYSVCLSVYCSSEAEKIRVETIGCFLRNRVVVENWAGQFATWKMVEGQMCVPVTEGTGSARTAPYFGTWDSNSHMQIFRAIADWPTIGSFFWPSHLHFRILRIVNLSHTNFGVSVGHSGPIFIHIHGHLRKFCFQVSGPGGWPCCRFAGGGKLRRGKKTAFLLMLLFLDQLSWRFVDFFVVIFQCRCLI